MTKGQAMSCSVRLIPVRSPLFAVFLAVFLALFLVPAPAQAIQAERGDASAPLTAGSIGGGDAAMVAQDDEPVYTSGNWRYKLYENGLAIVGYSGIADELVIPQTLAGQAVVSLAYDGTNADDRNAVWGNATSVKVGKGITGIGYSTFQNCTNIAVVDISQSSLTGIGPQAFANTGITSITVPATLKAFGAEAFDGMPHLRDFYFSVNSEPLHDGTPIWAGDEKFQADEYYNPAPRSPHVTYHVPSGNVHFKVVDGILFSKDGSVLYSRPVGMDGSTYTVPSSVRYIAANAFLNSEKLRSVKLNEGLTTIGMSAFAYTKLASVTIPGSVRVINSWAFYQMPNLESVVFQDGMTDLWNKAAQSQFSACPNLKTLKLPKTLRRIGNAAFASTGLESVNIPASVTAVNYAAFADCPRLVRITGCQGLERVYENAFSQTAIRSFPFGDNLMYVNGTAFDECEHYPQPAYPDYLTANSFGDRVRYEGPVHVAGTENYDMAFQVLDLLNAERTSRGLNVLSMDADLLEAAMQRASELTVLFDHDRPSGEDCFGASPKMGGENVAALQYNAQAVMKSWMNSEGHRETMLAEGYSSIGVGCFMHEGAIYWVQAFGDEKASPVAAKPGNRKVVRAINLVSARRHVALSLKAVNGSAFAGSSMQLRVCSEESFAYGRLQPSDFTWTSSDTSVATVSAQGDVTIKKAGSVVITAALRNSKQTFSLAISASQNEDWRRSGRDTLALPLGDGLMYRLYNPYSGEHFYTVDPGECVDVYAAGWNYEGIGWTAPATSNTPVYRLYNKYGGEHHYTTNAAEQRMLVAAGWNDEGIGWYSDDARSMPLYRQYNPNAFSCNHNYTADKGENDYLVSLGWKYEGIAWYGLA